MSFNTIKDPDDWTTGDEKMTVAQRSYLSTLSSEAGEEFDENLTKAEASKKIDDLQRKTGRDLKIFKIFCDLDQMPVGSYTRTLRYQKHKANDKFKPFQREP